MLLKRPGHSARRVPARVRRTSAEPFASRNREIFRRAVFQLELGGDADFQLLPFWQVNVPAEERKEACPEALQNLSAKDMGIIGTRDEDYQVQSWDQVVDIVRSGMLQDFKRWPSELRWYREFVWDVMRDEGSVMKYILAARLHWVQPIVARSTRPFEHEDDFKILFNDWPYGIDDRIVHLVVWTKFELKDDTETGAEIQRLIDSTFLSEMARDKVSGASSAGMTRSILTRAQLVWFKNPPSLKSVHAVEHFHVMLFDPDPALTRRLTGGDKPHGRQLPSNIRRRR